MTQKESCAMDFWIIIKADCTTETLAPAMALTAETSLKCGRGTTRYKFDHFSSKLPKNCKRLFPAFTELLTIQHVSDCSVMVSTYCEYYAVKNAS